MKSFGSPSVGYKNHTDQSNIIKEENLDDTIYSTAEHFPRTRILQPKTLLKPTNLSKFGFTDHSLPHSRRWKDFRKFAQTSNINRQVLPDSDYPEVSQQSKNESNLSRKE